MNRNYWPGLEVDRRNQDEYPTVYNAPHMQPVAAVQLQHAGSAPLEKTAPESNGRTCGLRKSVFWLVIALVIAVTMGAVGAGVAGSLAASRKADADREAAKTAHYSSVATPSTTSSFQDPSFTVNASTATSTPSASSAASSSQATGSSSNPSKATSVCSSAPTSNCQSLPSPYSPPHQPGLGIQYFVQFSILCQNDNDLPYFMAMHTNTFEDCISACASYTTNLQPQAEGDCAIVTYEDSDLISCWLKRSNGTMRTHSNTRVSVAFLLPN